MTDQQTEQTEKKETISIEVKRFGNGRVRQIELSKKQWSITRESLDRWLFTEVRS